MKIDSKILTTTINDLRDKYFDDLPLMEEEELALDNYDQYRIKKLNSATSDEEFKLFYFKMQAMANVSSYRYFLDTESIINCLL